MACHVGYILAIMSTLVSNHSVSDKAGVRVYKNSTLLEQPQGTASAVSARKTSHFAPKHKTCLCVAL
jgi:hypothetical protein